MQDSRLAYPSLSGFLKPRYFCKVTATALAAKGMGPIIKYQERFMTMRLCAAVVDDFGAHLYEVGLGKGDAVGGAHGAAEQLGGGRGGGGGRATDRREGREQRVDDGESGLERIFLHRQCHDFDTLTTLVVK